MSHDIPPNDATGQPTRRVFMVRYRCKPDQVARNVELVRNLFDELHQTQPGGIGYAVFGLEDGVSFIQLVVTETGGKLAPLADIESYQKLQEDKADRFEDGPFITELRELGSYRISPNSGEPG